MTVFDLPINRGKIWREFRTLPEFIHQVVRGRECKARCNGCDTDWTKSETVHVHAAVRKDKAEMAHFCDDCLDKLDSND